MAATESPCTIQFDSTASQPRHGFVVVYDLEGFSRFFNQPDVQYYVPGFINHVSAAISACLYGGEAYWISQQHGALIPPIQEKYLGDGAMYIWLNTKEKPIDEPFVHRVCNRLWNLKSGFEQVLKAASDFLPVVDIPRRIRFGLARGTIYELTRQNSAEREYIGFCINLATRLQKYCPELGFIASARIGLPQATLEEFGYVKVIATQLKGFTPEVVFVDKSEWEALGPSSREKLFEAI
jgi:class 3 adenylate cyclase